MKKFFQFILLLNLFICVDAKVIAQTKTFVISYGANDAPPYAITDNHKLTSGIIKDLFDQLAQQLNITIEYVQTPRKRAELYLNNGRIDAIAVSNPKWLANSDSYQWSEPLFAEQDWLVTLTKKKKKITAIEQMKGMIIGTTRGYVYPKLSNYFTKNTIIRSDAKNLQANFKRLQLERLDGFIDADILINYYFQQHYSKTQQREFSIEKVNISQHYVHTAISANSPVSASQFNHALSQLKQQGIIDTILKKYGIH